MAARSERTWEALVVLPASFTGSKVTRAQFPWACDILGLYPSIARATSTGKALPSLDEILVDIRYAQDQHLTSRFPELDTGAQPTVVTLGSFRDTLLGARTTLIELNRQTTGVEQSEVTVEFSWKVPAVAAALYEDVAVGLAFHVRRRVP